MKDERKWDVVTGGAGFIGSHLTEELLRRGRRVRIVDDFSTGRRTNIPPGVDLLDGDVVDLAEEAVQGAEDVYHLAAMASVPRSIAEPVRSHRATAESTLALLEAGERSRIRCLVLASSSAVYGESPELPKREGRSPAPVSPYAVAKLCSELYASHWATFRSLKTVSLRFFNVYGPRQDPDSPYAAAIPIFLRQLRNGEPLSIYGKGDQTRDFVFVKDVVRGLLSAAHSPQSSGRTYNLAGGRPISILELVSTLARISGKTSSLRFLPPRPGDVRESWADISLASRELGFVPQVSLEEGLRETIAWFEGAWALPVS
jgi:UDP-glucose 4-epimerase